jgi:hypothetical protein
MIKHIKCDIFESGADVICHQVNCQGVMGSGVAKQVREKYPWVYGEYKEACNSNMPAFDLLGWTQCVYINETQMIANIYAQENYGYDGKCYTDYKALRDGLKNIVEWYPNKSVAIPYLMGCHRGGGDWNVVYKMIEEVFADFDGEVLICEYNGG